MLKYWPEDTSITFSEFPDEIALCINITNCPCNCTSCSEPWLKEDKGIELTYAEVDKLISEHTDCTTFGFMGGDSDHVAVSKIADYIHDRYKNPRIKVGIYSGREFIDLDLAQHLDLYKIGRWIAPGDDKEDWKNHSWGPLVWPVSNQLYFEKINGKLVNATEKFRRQPINDWDRFLIKPEEN